METVKLTEVFGQAQESLIVVNANRVNNGELRQSGSGKSGPRDFYFMEEDKPEEVLGLIKGLCSRRLSSAFQLSPLDDTQVMTPMHRGTVGVANLNAELQSLLNPKGKEVPRDGRLYRVGDKVMQVRNNYDKEVFNGDMGRIAGIGLEEQKVSVKQACGSDCGQEQQGRAQVHHLAARIAQPPLSA